MRRTHFPAVCLLLLGLLYDAYAQQTDSLDALQKQAPRVYIDCDFCDLDYIRTEIPFVNYVRDRREAQVHVLITTQRTGSGGTEYTLTFIGQENFAALQDTLLYAAGQTATNDEQRQGYTEMLRRGLAPYALRTPIAERLTIRYEAPAGTTAAQVRDPWNYWVFRLSGNAFFNGQSSSNSLNLNTNVSANRITEDWKIELSGFNRYSEDNFEINDSTTIKSTSEGRGVDGRVVKSLSDHWSFGSRAVVSSSTFNNTDLLVRAGPAIEYNLFSYAESTRRQVRIGYDIGLSHYQYTEETIFEKTEESLVSGEFSVAVGLNQPWGNIDVSLNASNFFHDFSKNRIEVFGGVSMRVVKGLSVNLFANASRIRDQIALPRGEATQEDILLRRRALQTSFDYFGSVGISYTFGSIYNNIVNPRFGNRGGGGFTISF
jgi:hypothetical protein